MDSRIPSTINDLVALGGTTYADLGPGKGPISIGLRKAGKLVIGVDAPWANVENFTWAKEHGVRMYAQEFFTGDLGVIEEKVDCFILAHCIAHFRFSPHILFEKIFHVLPSGGYFYLSTVNAASFERVLDLFRGKPVTERVNKHIVQRSKEISKDWNRTGIQQIWDDWMHVKEYTKPEIEEMMKLAGFTIHVSKHRNNWPQFDRTFWKRNLLLKFFPGLADEIVVIGRKP